MNRYLPFAIFALGLFVRCAIGPLAGGSTDKELGSIVKGSINDRQGEPLANVPVVLIPQLYDPVKGPPLPDSLRDTTDFMGEYRMRHVPSGSYNILVSDMLSVDNLLITDIRVDLSDTTIVPPHSFFKPGFLRIVNHGSQVQTGSYVYIPGTPFFAPLENDTAFCTGVPAGLIPSVNFASVADTLPPLVIKTDFSIASDDTTTLVYYAGWKYSKRIFLNTTSTGIYVSGTVYGFPVLIRLNWRNFDFKQADGKGKDLRFTKHNGTPLPFEIERWDPFSKLAEVWVKVDTIYGNNNTQSIMMLYGNPDAASESNGAAVFDTANGFVGVWHLNESCGSTVFDATLNHYDGVPSPSGPTTVPGNINMAKLFDGKSQYITMPNTANSKLNFQENGFYSISAWVSVDKIKSEPQAILSKGNRQYSLAIKDSFCAFTEFKNMIGWETARSTPSMTYITVPAKMWILFTGIREGNRQTLYIDDGLCTCTANEFIPSAKSRLTSFDLSIGRTVDPDTSAAFYLAGIIDEVRVYNVALTEDWVRLCFKNQIWNGALVRFE